MLSKPMAGWTQVTFANLVYSASYTTEVPIDFLENLVKTLDTKTPHAFVLDTESEGEYTILLDLDRSYLIHFDMVLAEQRPILEIAKEVYEDIRSEYTEWSKWTPLEEDWDEYAKVLSAFLKDLHKSIQAEEQKIKAEE